MSESLKISVVVDAAQVAAGMQGVTTAVESATARIKSAFGSVEKAPEGIRNALMILQNQSRMSAEAVTEATAAITALGGESSAAEGGVAALGAAGRETASSMTAMERAMALASARLAGFGAGAGMAGTALGRVAAQSSVLGPILAAAFPVVAIGAFIDITSMAYDKIIEVSSGLAGWDKAAQQMYDTLVSLNQQTVSFNANLEIEKLRLNEAGLKGITLDLQKEKDAKAELQIRTDELTASLQRENSIRQQLEGTKKTEQFFDPRTRMTTSHTFVEKPDKDEVTRLNKELEEALKNSQRLSEEIQKLQQVSIPGEQKKEPGDREAELERSRDRVEKLNAALQKLQAEQDRVAQSAKKLADQEAEFGAEQNSKNIEKQIGDLSTRAAAEEEFRQATLAREREAAIAAIDLKEQQVSEDFRLGKISTDQEMQQLNALEAQKLQIEETYLNKRISEVLARLQSDDAKAYAADLKEWQQLLDQKQKDEQNYQRNRQKIVDNAATAEQKTWEKMTQGLNRLFDQSIQGIVMGTERFSTAFAHLIDGMLAKFIEAMLQMVEQWVVTHVFMLEVKKATQAEEVLSDAKAAAASAWKAVVGIPVIGPELAPIAAATAFAGVEAFSAAGGFDVPRDMIGLVHANEMILPANISTGLKKMIGEGSGGPQINVRYGDINAIDARGVKEVLSQHSEHIAMLMQRQLRRANAI